MIRDLALDLGTTTVSLVNRDRNIILSEPSVVVRAIDTGEVVTAGTEADKMVGRTPAGLETVRPLHGGTIVDFESAEAMLRAFFNQVGVRKLGRPRVVVCVPSSITPVEQRAVREAVGRAGAGEVRLIGQTMAAALGCGLPLDQPVGSMVVDLGGGTTEAAVVSLGGLVALESRRTGGLDLDEDIRRFVEHRHGIQIGLDTARRLKHDVGSAIAPAYDVENLPSGGSASQGIAVRGRQVDGGAMIEVEVTATEVADAMNDRLLVMIDAAVACLGWTQPEIANDLIDTGMHLVGGGALLDGMAERLADQTRIPVAVAAEPTTAAVAGAARCLGLFDRIEEIFLTDQVGTFR